MPITAIERRLIAGEREPHFSDDVKRKFLKMGVRQPVVMVKLCLDSEGRPNLLELHRSSGLEAADDRVLAAVSAWRFQPYLKDDEAVPLCTAIMFRYNIGPPPAPPPPS